MSYSATKDANGIWIASSNSLLTREQRIENKIKRKLERGETLSGPFASSPSGQAQQQAKLDAQNARIKQLEEQVARLLALSGALDEKGQLKAP